MYPYEGCFYVKGAFICVKTLFKFKSFNYVYVFASAIEVGTVTFNACTFCVKFNNCLHFFITTSKQI